MSIQLFYAISSQQDCTNTCQQQQSDCQGYSWDISGNCNLYYLVGGSSNATIIPSRPGKIPQVNDYSASQTNCITSTCKVLKTNDLYDFNKCVQLCNADSDCQGFGANGLQYCSLIKSSGTQGQFTGYSFIKQESPSIAVASNTLPIVIGVIAAVVVFIAIILFIMVKRFRKPIKNQQQDEDAFYDPRPQSRTYSSNKFNSMASVEEPMLPRPLSYTQIQGKEPQLPSSQFKIANATYNDLWSSSRSLDRRDTTASNNRVPIPGIDTSTHIDYHMSKEEH